MYQIIMTDNLPMFPCNILLISAFAHFIMLLIWVGINNCYNTMNLRSKY